jgi:hypothetical protein
VPNTRPPAPLPVFSTRAGRKPNHGRCAPRQRDRDPEHPRPQTWLGPARGHGDAPASRIAFAVCHSCEARTTSAAARGVRPDSGAVNAKIGEPSATVCCGPERQLAPLERAPSPVQGCELRCATQDFVVTALDRTSLYPIGARNPGSMKVANGARQVHGHHDGARRMALPSHATIIHRPDPRASGTSPLCGLPQLCHCLASPDDGGGRRTEGYMPRHAVSQADSKAFERLETPVTRRNPDRSGSSATRRESVGSQGISRFACVGCRTSASAWKTLATS